MLNQVRQAQKQAAVTSSKDKAISASTRIRPRKKLVFNRTVSLRDSWAKIEKAQKVG